MAAPPPGSLQRHPSYPNFQALRPCSENSSSEDDCKEHAKNERVLRAVENHFKWGKRHFTFVGDGSSKQVYQTGPWVVAIVRNDPRALQRTIFEATLLQNLPNCPHIPFITELFHTRAGSAFIQNYAGEDLFAHFLDPQNRNRQTASIDEIETILKQLLEALSYLHEKGITHGDVSPDNCAIGEYYQTTLLDFGLAVPPEDRFKCYSPYNPIYRPPEVCLLKESQPLSDIWALGATVYELWMGTQLIPDEFLDKLDNPTEKTRLFSLYRQMLGMESQPSASPSLTSFEAQILKKLKSNLTVRDCELIDLLRKMLLFDPKNRITAKDALNHRFFCSTRRTDLAFRIKVVGSQDQSQMLIKNDNRQILQIIPLSSGGGLRCHHIPKRAGPYRVEFYSGAWKRKKPDKIIEDLEAAIGAPLDQTELSINNDNYEITN